MSKMLWRARPALRLLAVLGSVALFGLARGSGRSLAKPNKAGMGLHGNHSPGWDFTPCEDLGLATDSGRGAAQDLFSEPGGTSPGRGSCGSTWNSRPDVWRFRPRLALET